jgi:hypothetical protein
MENHHICTNLSVIHHWNSIITNSRVWKHHLIHNWNSLPIFLCFLISVRKFQCLQELGHMDKAISSETGYSSNMKDFPASKKEKVVAHILATKFHTEPVADSKSEVRLNPIMRDLVINNGAVKKKWSKRPKKEAVAEAAESFGENQPVWLDTLKEEITKLK